MTTLLSMSESMARDAGRRRQTAPNVLWPALHAAPPHIEQTC